MRRRVSAPRGLVPAAVLAAILLWPASALADWSPVQSTQLNSAGTSVLGVSAASVGGVPYVAWAEAPAANPTIGPVYVSRLSGSTFVPVGGAVGDCEGDPVITDIGGAPFVGCVDFDLGVINVYTLEGSSWVQVGPSIPGGEGFPMLGGIADVEGEPWVSFVPAYDTSAVPEVQVDAYSGGAEGTWSQVGASLIGQAGDQGNLAELLSDGSTPIVAWDEAGPTNSEGYVTSYVFADQLHDGTWTALNSGDPLNPVSSDEGSQLHGVAMIGLGSYAAAPLAVTAADGADGVEQLTALTLTDGKWDQLGSPLGVPPLPTSDDGDPYGVRAIAVDTQTGTPYVALLQQQNNSTTEIAPEDLFVEAYTAGGKNPTGPTAPKQYPPTTTTSKVPDPKLGSVKPPSGVLELASGSTLSKRKHTTHLNSGIRAACPSEKRHPACHGEIVLKVKKLQLTWEFTVSSGHSTTLSTSLSAGNIAQLGRSTGRLIRGTITVTLSGPNATSTSLSESLHARLP
jgi:hypothetical protein